jgi:ABC-type branched-subunit amino acid transport system ATPase component
MGRTGRMTITQRAALEVTGVDFSYGQLQVLFDVDIHVDEGERVALLGTNGAGKSTLLHAISGLGPTDRGIIRFHGRDITKLGADERTNLGLVQIAGGRAIFPTLTVLENIRLGGYRLRNAARVDRTMAEALDVFPQLESKLSQPAGLLSGGEQQMVALARALVAEPRLLIIDELSLGLAPIVIAEIMKMIDRFTAMGTSMLIVEQSLNLSLVIAERAYFMERGSIRFEGAAKELAERDDLVRSVFFGSEG